jgi:hypothetical protein
MRRSALTHVNAPNLKVLAKKNNGVFPVDTVYAVIEGRATVAAHGTRDMPIWGLRYMPDSNKAASPTTSSNFIDLSYDPEAVVRARILSLIDYLNRIQEK